MAAIWVRGDQTRPRVVVVGAGVAGLTAARSLAAFSDVVVVDKGRGVGGRLATRRIGLPREQGTVGSQAAVAV